MKCRKAEAFMMKYLDNNITKEEMEQLDEHISNCMECNNAFNAYKAIDFPPIQVQAPEIEDKIMSKIYTIPLEARDYSIIYFIISGISSLIGLSMLFVINKRDIIVNMLNFNVLSDYVHIFDTFTNAIWNMFNTSLCYVNGCISSEMWQLLGVMTVIMLVTIVPEALIKG